MRRTNKFLATMLAALCAMAVVLAGCASGKGYIKFPDANEQLEKGDYAGARAELTKQRETNKFNEYNLNNEISYQLDQGLLAHYAGDYAASTENLTDAERKMDEAYTKSVSERVSRVIKDDRYSIEYVGEQYENFYVSVFSALNFYHQGNIEGAQVEIRRMYEKMNYFQTMYEDRMVELGEEDWRTKVHGAPTYYYKSVLGSYLGMLFFRGINNDFARIDAQTITEAYKEMPEVYLNPLPKELVMRGDVNDELSIPAGMARVNFLSFTGLVPLKSDGALAYRRSPANRIEIVFQDGRKMNLSLLEPMSNVVYQVARTRLFYKNAEQQLMANITGGIQTAQYVATLATEAVSAELYVGLYVAGLFVEMFRDWNKDFDSKNRAIDKRMANYVPGNAYIGGINLPPGTYSFKVNYYDGDKLIDSRSFENRQVQAGKLNLIEDFCLKTEEEYVPGYLRYPKYDRGYTGVDMVKMETRKGSLEVPIKDYHPRPLTLNNVRWEVLEVKKGVEGAIMGTIKYTWDPVPGALQYIVYKNYIAGFTGNDGSHAYREFWGIDTRTTESEFEKSFYTGSNLPKIRVMALVGTDGYSLTEPFGPEEKDLRALLSK